MSHFTLQKREEETNQKFDIHLLSKSFGEYNAAKYQIYRKMENWSKTEEEFFREL